MGIRDIPIKVGMSFEESADYDSTMIQNPVLSDVQELMKLMIKVEVSPFGQSVKKKKCERGRPVDGPSENETHVGTPPTRRRDPTGSLTRMAGRDLRWQPL